MSREKVPPSSPRASRWRVAQPACSAGPALRPCGSSSGAGSCRAADKVIRIITGRAVSGGKAARLKSEPCATLFLARLSGQRVAGIISRRWRIRRDASCRDVCATGVGLVKSRRPEEPVRATPSSEEVVSDHAMFKSSAAPWSSSSSASATPRSSGFCPELAAEARSRQLPSGLATTPRRRIRPSS